MRRYIIILTLLVWGGAVSAKPLLDQRIPVKLETATFGLG